MNDRWIKLITTFFYTGYFPVAPGSLASVAGALLCVGMRGHPVLTVLLFAGITALGFWASGPMEKICKEKDPSCIVIDEVAGAMIAFFLLPVTPSVCLTAFFLFRAFDMFKIYPVNKLEKIPGGTGVMMDDLFAGLYTNITMHLAIRLAGV